MPVPREVSYLWEKQETHTSAARDMRQSGCHRSRGGAGMGRNTEKAPAPRATESPAPTMNLGLVMYHREKGKNVGGMWRDTFFL